MTAPRRNSGIDNLTVASKAFVQHCRTARSLSAHTLRAYEGDLGDFRQFLGRNLRVSSLRGEDARRYAGWLVDERKLSHATARRRIATLRVFLAWAERERATQENLFHGLDLSIKIPKRLPRTLQSSEMRLLLRVGSRNAGRKRCVRRYGTFLEYFTLVALFTTGLRVGELVSARVADVDFNDGAIQVRGKGNRERRVFMPGVQAVRILQQFVALRRGVATASEQLLVGISGRPVSARTIRRWLRRLAGEAGISRRVTPHMLRHTAATELLNAGVDIRFVQQLLGHASIATTQIYTHVSNSSLRNHLTRANTLARVG